ncbi:MAG: hypothetical protein HY329_22520 [Chloroflexi bacterium]|nr:hypothetical protein [Chloroflexota bacterium]
MTIEDGAALRAPLTADIRRLAAGDRVRLSGELLVVHPNALAQLCETVGRRESLPAPLDGAVLATLTPASATGDGAMRPTNDLAHVGGTAQLLAAGVRATIGVGPASLLLAYALRKYGGVHLVAPQPELFPASIRHVGSFGDGVLGVVTVDQLDLVVANDSRGGVWRG